MPLHTLVKIVRHKKRVGRGIGSRGAKSGRGMKGQRSRAGSHQKAGFEGGQTPLYMRLPKERGTKQTFASQVVKPITITTAKLNQFPNGSIVGPSQLRQRKIIGRHKNPIKIVGNDKIKVKLTVRAHAATENATKQIKAAGGKLEIIAPHK